VVTEEFQAEITAWAQKQPDVPALATATRRLVEIGLNQDKVSGSPKENEIRRLLSRAWSQRRRRTRRLFAMPSRIGKIAAASLASARHVWQASPRLAWRGP
jgi:hypothetical protein